MKTTERIKRKGNTFKFIEVHSPISIVIYATYSNRIFTRKLMLIKLNVIVIIFSYFIFHFFFLRFSYQHSTCSGFILYTKKKKISLTTPIFHIFGCFELKLHYQSSCSVRKLSIDFNKYFFHFIFSA